MSDEILEVRKDRVLKAMESCGEAEEILKILFPGVKDAKAEFVRVGDIVRVHHAYMPQKVAGKVGRVIDVRCNGEDIGIEFHQHLNTHGCYGKAKHGHGWYLSARDLELLYREPEDE